MSFVSAEALRAACLAAAGPHADERAVRVLEDGRLDVDPAVVAWDSTDGRVEGHRVRVGLGAARLGMVRGHPQVEDEIVRLVSAGVASLLRGRTADVVFFHDPHASAHHAVTAYRGEGPATTGAEVGLPAGLHALVRDYLVAAGEPDAADVASRAELALGPGGAERPVVRVRYAPGDAATLRERVDACLRDLFG